MNSEFDYTGYVKAMNVLASIKGEIESQKQLIANEQSKNQERIEADRQNRHEKLEQIREQAVEQFRALSLRYREVCNRPAEVATPIRCSSSVERAIQCQMTTAIHLQKALDSVVAEHEAARKEAIRRREEERMRRQQILDQELASAGHKPVSR